MRHTFALGAAGRWIMLLGITSLSLSAVAETEPPREPVDSAATSDPFELMFRRAVEAMDESYDGWNHRADETVDSTTFTINYTASISVDGRRRLDRVMILHADENQDRSVNRDEALRFLEIQLGMRWVTGDSLRAADGSVVDFAKFLELDTDQDDAISLDEVDETLWDDAISPADFQLLDLEEDGLLSLAEFSDPDGPNVVDPIETFRKADVDNDELLDEKELRRATEKRRMHLVKSNLAGFDDNGDGKLSLSEYRLSMLGNYNYPWETIPRDDDRDHLLSFDEFKFHKRDLFQLQRRYYFHRLDRDGDGFLSAAEFEFSKHKLHSLYRVSVNGEESTELYRHEDFPVLGSPSVSPDGGWILFDATPPEGANKAQILLMTSDGADVRDLCDGLMPSWSSDGSQFACSRYEGGTGIWIMNMDGTPDRRIDDGWAAQWSPDGKSIAYTNDNSVRVYDVASGESRVVLPKGSHHYQYIYWNMSWSPDSRQIVLRAKKGDRQEIAIVNATGDPQVETLFSSNKDFGFDLAWSPTGPQILFNMYSRKYLREVIFKIDLRNRGRPKPLLEANTAMRWSSIAFSPDGKWMVLTTPN